MRRVNDLDHYVYLEQVDDRRFHPKNAKRANVDRGRASMFGRGKSSSERVRGKTKWRGVWAAIAALCLSGGAVVSASPAFACDINNHCSAIASYGTSGLYGGRATIAPISGPGIGATGDFATGEVWLVGTNSAYWVEVGYIANLANVNGVSRGTSEFWFDSRPAEGRTGTSWCLTPHWYLTTSASMETRLTDTQ
ncbi:MULTISPECIES: hypothetical protein [Leifsonia]|uniref:hypothetical protein n=1 Tax=Leifsonia TaxID=110932 RepID=UPI0028AC031F|nr:hypothetical protein [Leifsonia aquatica]